MKSNVNCCMHIGSLESCKGDNFIIPANTPFTLVINYENFNAKSLIEFDKEYHYKIFSEKDIGFFELMPMIYKGYKKYYEDINEPTGDYNYRCDFNSLYFEGITVDFDTKLITVDMGT